MHISATWPQNFYSVVLCEQSFDLPCDSGNNGIVEDQGQRCQQQCAQYYSNDDFHSIRDIKISTLIEDCHPGTVNEIICFVADTVCDFSHGKPPVSFDVCYKVIWLPFKASGQVFSACPFFSAACLDKEQVSDGPAGETDAFLSVSVAAGYVFCVYSWQLLSVFCLLWHGKMKVSAVSNSILREAAVIHVTASFYWNL